MTTSEGAGAQTITEHELAQCERANQTGRPRSCSSTGCGCCPSAGTGGRRCSRSTAMWPSCPGGRTTRHRRGGGGASRGVRPQIDRPGGRPLRDHHPGAGPEVCRHRPLLRGLLTQILAGRGLARVSVAIDPAPFRGVLPLPISSLKSAFLVLGNPANRSRAEPLTNEQLRYGSPTPSTRTRPKSCTRPTPCPPWACPVPGGHGQPEPLNRGQGRHQEPGPGPPTDHLGREGPHRPLGDRQRLPQAAAGEPGRDRGRGDEEPRPRPDHRQRLAPGGRDRPSLRPALQRGAVNGWRLWGTPAWSAPRPGSWRSAGEARRPAARWGGPAAGVQVGLGRVARVAAGGQRPPGRRAAGPGPPGQPRAPPVRRVVD
jgi:hypothetical protein